jgi:hypothetical protein
MPQPFPDLADRLLKPSMPRRGPKDASTPAVTPPTPARDVYIT